ncbi:hypothetical protein CSPAE12_01786 [Colletotrichum incanum]|nr:hypothetical protein CSPAE12_01786 [Colletotrichum incanum]
MCIWNFVVYVAAKHIDEGLVLPDETRFPKHSKQSYALRCPDTDKEDATAELAKQLKRANKDIANIQAIFNENATALKQL